MPAKSKSQQRLMGMVHKCQKDGDCVSDKIKKIADSIKSSDATDFAETKHKNLPNKVKESYASHAYAQIDNIPITFRQFIMEGYYDNSDNQQLNEIKDEAELRVVEQHLTQMFKDVGVKRVVFTWHGAHDRALGRNSDVTPKEISELFFRFKQKHLPKMISEIENRGRFQAVIKDYSANLNFVIDYTINDGEMRIITLERKKPNNFKGSKWPKFLQLKVW